MRTSTAEPLGHDAPPIARFPLRALALRVVIRASVALLAAVGAVAPLAYSLLTSPDEPIPPAALVVSVAFAVVFVGAVLALYLALDGAVQHVAFLYGFGQAQYVVLTAVCALFPPLAVLFTMFVALDVARAIDNGHLRRRSARARG